jgi:transposase
MTGPDRTAENLTKVYAPGFGVVPADSPEARIGAASLRVKVIREHRDNALDLVATAIEQRDWEALDLAGPADWLALVFDEQAIARKVRRRLVAALRAEGYSLRSAALELGISKSTAARDLADVSHDGTAEQPERITGADGKSYAATRPEPEERVLTLQREEPETEEEPGQESALQDITELLDAVQAKLRHVHDLLPLLRDGAAREAVKDRLEQIYQAAGLITWVADVPQQGHG